MYNHFHHRRWSPICFHWVISQLVADAYISVHALERMETMYYYIFVEYIAELIVNMKHRTSPDNADLKSEKWNQYKEALVN